LLIDIFVPCNCTNTVVMLALNGCATVTFGMQLKPKLEACQVRLRTKNFMKTFL